MCSKCTFYHNKKLDGLFKKKNRNKLIHRQKQATQPGKPTSCSTVPSSECLIFPRCAQNHALFIKDKLSKQVGANILTEKEFFSCFYLRRYMKVCFVLSFYVFAGKWTRYSWWIWNVWNTRAQLVFNLGSWIFFLIITDS